MSLYKKMAEAIGHHILKCQTCGKEHPVDAANYLRYGWPKCCGYTVRLIRIPDARKSQEGR